MYNLTLAKWPPTIVQNFVYLHIIHVITLTSTLSRDFFSFFIFLLSVYILYTRVYYNVVEVEATHAILSYKAYYTFRIARRYRILYIMYLYIYIIRRGVGASVTFRTPWWSISGLLYAYIAYSRLHLQLCVYSVCEARIYSIRVFYSRFSFFFFLL